MSYSNLSEIFNWYVIHTHRQQEGRVDENLNTLGIETFVPLIKKQRNNNFVAKVSHVVKPFFPGYVFARFDVTRLLHKVRLTRGVHSVVSYGIAPARVDNRIIAMIQSRIGGDGYVHIDESFKPGDKVIIEDGPLKDFGGIFERETSDANRVMILLQAVSFRAHLVVERELLKKDRHSTRSSSDVY